MSIGFQKTWTIIITIAICIFIISQARAETSNGIFADWQGEFINQAFVYEMPEMDAVYKKIADESKKRGETQSIEQIKAFFKTLGTTTFHRLSMAGDDITFYDKQKNHVKLGYKSLGSVPDTYGDHKLEWYAFEATEKEGKASEYRYIIMLKIHQHQNGQSHFHIRYGNKGVKELTGLGGMGNWWPTMVKPDFDVTAYINSINPKLMAKLLPGGNTK